MTRAKWEDLAKLADLMFEVEAKKLTELLGEENKLQRQRQRLKALNAAALKEFDGGHVAHKVDGDFHWQMWVGQNAQRIGQQQARARAMSEMHKPALRKAYGRKSVLSALSKK